MTYCPSDEEIKSLLADALGAATRDAVAQHVEGCASCQEKLASLTATPEPETWRRAVQSLKVSEAEEQLVRRLKGMHPSSGPMRLEREAVDFTSKTADLGPADGQAGRPTVPGYEILGELGRGGMGVVYQARQLALQRTVALKMILIGTHARPRDLARFRAEAEVLARLQHQNIVQVYDVGEAAGRPYFALEFVAGGSLAQHLAGKPLPARPAAQLIETLARAAHAAHAHGVVHRDLKPANILLVSGGVMRGEWSDASSPFTTPPLTSHDSLLTPKITDFGLAKFVDDDGEATGRRGPTITGEFLGTPNYMAPEQAATPRQPVGPPADIYALGAILYELLTGRPPFTGETPLETVLQVLHNEPVSVTRLQPSVPRDLETVCLKCLQKEPRKRYASALELADDLHRFLTGEPIRARPVSVVEQAWKWVRRRPGMAGLSAAVVLVTAAALGLVTWQWQRAEGQKVQAQHAEGKAEERRRQAEEAEARLALQQGQVLCERGELAAGLLWLARALDRAASAGAAELDRPIRIN